VHEDVEQTIAEPVPMNLRNPVTRPMKEWGYGQGYQHAHQFEDAIVDMECLPPSLAGRRYYFPPAVAWRSALRRGWRRFGGSGRRVSRKTGTGQQFRYLKLDGCTRFALPECHPLI